MDYEPYTSRHDSSQKLVVGEPEEDLLVAFLYLLGRDHLPLGVMEGVMRHHVDVLWLQQLRPRFSNEHLAAWARSMAVRLRRSVTSGDEEARAAYRAEERRLMDEILARDRHRPPPTEEEKAAMDEVP